MANICDNTFYAYSENSKNIDHIEKFLSENFYENCCERIDEFSLDAHFDSKWTFPNELMDKMFNELPDKDNIYMRCLSVEYGCDYIGYFKCEDKLGWYDALI